MLITPRSRPRLPECTLAREDTLALSVSGRGTFFTPAITFDTETALLVSTEGRVPAGADIAGEYSRADSLDIISDMRELESYLGCTYGYLRHSAQECLALLGSRLTELPTVITAPCAGYVTDDCDGYESSLDTLAPSDITLQLYDELMHTAPDEPGAAKLLCGDRLYCAVELSPADSVRASVGDSCSLLYDGGSITVTVENILSSDRITLLLLSSVGLPPRGMPVRFQHVKLIFDEIRAIPLPRNAVFETDDGMFVYALHGTLVLQRRVEPICTVDDILWVSSYPTSTPDSTTGLMLLSHGEQLILDTKDQFHMKKYS